MTPPVTPHGRGPVSGQTMFTVVIGVLVVVIGTFALMTMSSQDGVDDETVHNAPLTDPTVLPNREAPTGSTGQGSQPGDPMVPR